MDFNDLTQKFTQKVKQLSKDTAEEVQKLNKIRQLNGKINDAKKQIENIYSEIGKKFYELRKDDIPEGFEEFIQTINDKTVEIEQLKEQVRETKGVVLCPGCNTEVSSDERFCPNCGSKMPEPVEVADEEDEAAVVVDTVDVTEAAKTTVDDVKEAAADVADDVKEATADAVDNMKEAAADVADSVKDMASDAVDDIKDAAKEKAEEIVEGAKEVAGNAADELKEAAEDLKENAEKMF